MLPNYELISIILSLYFLFILNEALISTMQVIDYKALLHDRTFNCVRASFEVEALGVQNMKMNMQLPQALSALVSVYYVNMRH